VSTDSKSSKSLSPGAIAELVAGHREFLTFLERRVESRAAAEDILQTAFVRGLERGAEVQDEKVVAWFYRVLRNAVIDHYRHRSTSTRALETWGREFSEGQEPDAAMRQEICHCVSGLLDDLKPEYRDALRVVDLDEGKLSDWQNNRELARKMPPSACIGPEKLCAVRWNKRAALVPSTGASMSL
jgi:RNA polymerase sigma-70 factor (ECF subfamily)